MSNGGLAYWRDGVWEQLTPRDGWTVYVIDTDVTLQRVAGAWLPLHRASARGVANRLVNGAFQFNQRMATSVADDTYCFDRFYVLTETGSVTVGQLSDPETGRLAGIRLTQPDATAKRIGLAQIVESADIRDLRSAAVAMAARVRCSASQAIRMAILEWTGTADAVTSDVVNGWTNATFTPGNFFIAGVNVIALGATTPTANTWTDMAGVSGTFGAALTNAIVLVWTEAALAQNGTLDIDQMQLEAGKICGPFARRRAGEELAACQRFYQKSFALGTTPAQNIGTNTGEWLWPASGAGAVTQRGVPCRFAVPLRASPTMTGYSTSAASAEAWDVTAGAACTGTNFFMATAAQFGVTALGAAGTAIGNRLGVHWTADAEL